AKLIVDAAQVSAADEVNTASIAITISVAATITTEEITLAQALIEINTSKPKAKGIVLQEPSESITITKNSLKKSQDKEEQEELTIEEKATLFKELFEKRRKHFAAKAVEEKRNKPSTQAQQIKIKMFDKAFNRVNIFVDFRMELVEGSSKRAREELTQESTKKQKGDMKTMFKLHVIDDVWRKKQGYKVLEWKLYDSHGVHSLRMQSVHIYMLVEKKYLLTAPTLTDMLNKKL
nr:hypothetical protein [Tanacetum cinerariifolium]